MDYSFIVNQTVMANPEYAKEHRRVILYVYERRRHFAPESIDGFVMFPEDGLSPSETVAHVRAQVRKGRFMAATASDHVINALRCAVHDGDVKPEDAVIVYFPVNMPPRVIVVDENGSLSEYPDGFLDTWNTCLMALMS